MKKFRIAILSPAIKKEIGSGVKVTTVTAKPDLYLKKVDAPNGIIIGPATNPIRYELTSKRKEATLWNAVEMAIIKTKFERDLGPSRVRTERIFREEQKKTVEAMLQLEWEMGIEQDELAEKMFRALKEAPEVTAGVRTITKPFAARYSHVRETRRMAAAYVNLFERNDCAKVIHQLIQGATIEGGDPAKRAVYAKLLRAAVGNVGVFLKS